MCNLAGWLLPSMVSPGFIHMLVLVIYPDAWPLALILLIETTHTLQPSSFSCQISTIFTKPSMNFGKDFWDRRWVLFLTRTLGRIFVMTEGEESIFYLASCKNFIKSQIIVLWSYEWPRIYLTCKAILTPLSQARSAGMSQCLQKTALSLSLSLSFVHSTDAAIICPHYLSIIHPNWGKAHSTNLALWF